MGGIMGGKPDDSALKKQQAELDKQERDQAAQLMAKRRAASSGSKSATLFSVVEGEGNSIAKKTTLGG